MEVRVRMISCDGCKLKCPLGTVQECLLSVKKWPFSLALGMAPFNLQEAKALCISNIGILGAGLDPACN